MHINKQAELNRMKLRGSAGADLRARDDVDAVRNRFYTYLAEGLSPQEAAAKAQGKTEKAPDDEREQIIARLNELGVKFQPNTGTKKLRAKLEEAEAETDDEDGDTEDESDEDSDDDSEAQ